MDINDLEAKVKLAEEKVEKIKTTIEKAKKLKEKKMAAFNKIIDENNLSFTYEDLRDRKVWLRDYSDQAFFSELYDVEYTIRNKEESIKNNSNKLKAAEQSLKNSQEKLRNEKAKLQYIQDNVPQVIKDFLLDWKNDIIKYIIDLEEQYIKDRDEYRQQINKIYYDFIMNHIDEYTWLHIDEYNPAENYRQHIRYQHTREVKNQHKYIQLTEEFLRKYDDNLFQSYLSKKFDNEWLDKELTIIMNNKLVELMQRVCKVTGVITNADLYVNKGDLNGIIYGEDGNARVETIGAGGYAVQRYHLRVLVKPIKN